MVEQNYILYVNTKKMLRQAPIKLTGGVENFRVQFTIPEKHLICGLILNGIPVKADRLKDFPFKPVEKYLFEFTNVFFVIPEMEYSHENTSYDFNIGAVEGVFKLFIPYEDPPFILDGEGTYMVYGATVQNLLDIENNQVYFHPSFDGVNFFKFSLNQYYSPSNGGSVPYTIYSVPYPQWLEDMGLNEGNWSVEALPLYIYFSDKLGNKTPIAHVEVL